VELPFPSKNQETSHIPWNIKRNLTCGEIIEAHMKKNQTQLSLIKDFLNLCTDHNIESWLMGGWGLDFLMSKETRSHSDIDLIADCKAYSSLSEIIAGFADLVTMNSEQKIKFIKDGTGFDLCFFFEIDHQYYMDLDEEDPLVYPMPRNSFPKNNFSKLSGIEARTISWEAQYVAKEGYFFYSNQPLREKDKQDLGIIKHNLSESLEKLEALLPGVEKERLGLSPPKSKTSFRRE